MEYTQADVPLEMPTPMVPNGNRWHQHSNKNSCVYYTVVLINAGVIITIFTLVILNYIQLQSLSVTSTTPTPTPSPVVPTPKSKLCHCVPSEEHEITGVVFIHGSGQGARDEAFSITFPNYALDPPKPWACNFTSTSGSVFSSLASIRTDDFAEDARNALKYLSGRSEIDASKLCFVGHSQGCTIAPYAASLYNQENGIPVKGIVLLMGSGVTMDSLYLKQMDNNIIMDKDMERGCAQTGDVQAASYFKSLADATITSRGYYEILFDAILNINSTIPDDSIVYPGGNPAGFWRSWQNMTKLDAKYKIWVPVNRDLTQVLAINSPGDLQVWSLFYRSLQSVLLSLPKQDIVKVKTIPRLTHFTTPADLSSGEVSSDVLESVINSILDTL